MSNVNEISRRTMYHEDEGIACGPVSTTAIDAEIVVDNNGQRVYLHAQWVDAAGDDILFEANTESIYDVYERLNNSRNDNDFQEALKERDRINQERLVDDTCYEDFYVELKQMILDVMAAHGIDGYFDEEDE